MNGRPSGKNVCAAARHLSWDGKQKKLHLLQGLQAILLDIDKAVRIVRETEEEAEVVPNLMIGFGIDQVQAEFVAEIRLRQLNREYILKRTQEVDQLQKDIADLSAILASKARVQPGHYQRTDPGGRKVRQTPAQPPLYTKTS